MNKPFCPWASSQLRFEYDQISPCCWITKKSDVNDPIAAQEYIKWIKNLNDWVPECEYCKNQEDRGIISGRLKGRGHFNSFNLLEEIDSNVNNETISLELQIDEDCNSACLMCSEKNSSTWKKYNSNSKEIKIEIDQTTKAKTENRINSVFDNIQAEKIKHITFLGGEPLKNSNHLKILNRFKEITGNLNDISVSYVSNGSYFPTIETQKIWQECKLVKLNLSIDGIGEHFNYLRWPLQWNQVENNIDNLFNLNQSNLRIISSYALTPFNIFYHDRYREWADKKGYEFFRHPFESVGVINLSVIPEKLQIEIKNKFESSFPMVVSLLKDFNYKEYAKFRNYVTLHDRKRNINWRTVFPEVSPYFI